VFSELPKLLDRDFAVGFFLPAAVMGAGLWIVLYAFGLTAGMPELEALTSTAIATFIVWLFSVVLLGFNHQILRCLEGYPKWLPLKSRERVQKIKFLRKIKPTLDLQDKIYAAADGKLPKPFIPADFENILSENIASYPDAEEYVLPTRFGNIFRALEVYSRVVYGLDAIPAWPRLFAVLPPEFKKQLAEANSLLAFFVNLAVSGTATLILYLALAVWARQLPMVWIPVVAVAVAVGSYHEASGQAMQYGIHVKSAFDLYRGELAKQLGLDLPHSADDEWKMWHAVGNMMIFRSLWSAKQLDEFRSTQVQD
jgi:hypothetical protein